MSPASVVFPKNVFLNPAPITPEWVISGTPEARNAVVAVSDDGLASTILWECSAGSFNWYYDFDETVYFIEGSVTIADAQGASQICGPGDILVFPAGSHAIWTVHTPIRKMAVCKRLLPRRVQQALGIMRKVRRLIKKSGNEGAGLLSPV